MDEVVLEKWARLMRLAAAVKAMAPWEILGDGEVFAVELPPPVGVGLVSVMGRLGEHFAVGLYLGAQAIDDFATAIHSDNPVDHEVLLEIDQVQISWEDAKQLDRNDKAFLVALGLKFRGRNAWPMLRRFRAGLVPWIVSDGSEIDMLSCALEQLLMMGSRLRANPKILMPPPESSYLLRHRVPEFPNEWTERFAVSPALEARVPPSLDDIRLKRLRALPHDNSTLEVDLFASLSMQMEGRDLGLDQPYYGYVLLLVDHATRMIGGFQILHGVHGRERLWADTLAAFADVLLKGGSRPTRIVVQRQLFYLVLETTCRELDIDLQLVARLDNLMEARATLDNFNRR